MYDFYVVCHIPKKKINKTESLEVPRTLNNKETVRPSAKDPQRKSQIPTSTVVLPYTEGKHKFRRDMSQASKELYFKQSPELANLFIMSS